MPTYYLNGMRVFAVSVVLAFNLLANDIDSLLKDSCLGCHGATQTLGKLDLRTREAMIKGGSRGPAIVPGDPDRSLLVAVLEGKNGLQMPPGGPEKKLSPEAIATVREWVRSGATAQSGETKWKYKPEDLWAFQPLRKPAAAATIDSFILQKLSGRGLKPAPPADKRTLIRRVTYDLTGLPPTAEETEAFLRDGSPDAYAKVVDRLLASPRYGERWGRHWLDVVRYADTDGYSNDFERPNAWRYRDYVIRSFNQDKPYNQFVLEQIAGDELDPSNPEMLVATGFLRMGPWEHTGMAVAAVTRQQWLDDVTHSTAATFLGFTLGCARCHDHKFDPIPTKEYYSMQAAFASTYFEQRPAPFLPGENVSNFDRERTQVQALHDWNEESLKKLQEKILPVAAQKRGLEGLDTSDLERERIYRKRMEIYRRQLERYKPLAFSVITKEPEETFVLTSGNLRTPDAKVMPAVLSAPAIRAELPVGGNGRRLALARWIASEDNPLTARVIVNRVWHYHFGRGIAGNPNNFGRMGKKPTHPELLDYLAAKFIDNGWSIKQLHRMILMSDTYRRASEHPDMAKVLASDPDNDLRAFFPPRRLSAEELRDSVLAAAGQLNNEAGGAGSFAEINEDVATQPVLIMGTLSPVWAPSPRKADRNRRSVYLYQKRGTPDPMLETFNQPGSNESCERRDATTVPMQAFALFNSKFARDMSLELAASATDVKQLFRRALGRDPEAREAQLLAAHWKQRTAYHAKNTPAAKQFRTPAVRSLIGEYTGKRFDFQEEPESATYQEYLHPSDVSTQVRGLADCALVLLNTNEFSYVY